MQMNKISLAAMSAIALGGVGNTINAAEVYATPSPPLYRPLARGTTRLGMTKHVTTRKKKNSSRARCQGRL